MAKARIEVDTDKKNKNKEAIQNINRTGTVSGRPSGVSNTNYVNTNTNTSDLSGNNAKQNGTSRAPKTVTSTATYSYQNPTQAAKKEKGKTFVSEVKTFKKEKTKYSDKTKQLHDNYLNTVNNLYEESQDDRYVALTSDPLYNDYMSDKDKKYVEQKGAELTAKSFNADVAKGDYGTSKELDEKSLSGKIRDEDVFGADESGNINAVDFSKEKTELNRTLGELQQKQLHEPENEELAKQIDETTNRLQEVDDKEKYQDARYRSLVYEYTKATGSEDEVRQLARLQGSYGNTVLEDIGLGVTSSRVRMLGGGISMYEGLANDIDYTQIEEYQDAIELKNKMYDLAQDPRYSLLMEQENLSPEEQQYVDSVNQQLKELNEQSKDLIEQANLKYSTMDKRDLGAQLNQIANELSFMQQNGESQTKRLVVNTIVSVIDNMTLQGTGAAVAGEAGMKAGTAIMSASAFGNTYATDLANGYTPRQALGHASLMYGLEYATELIGGERMVKLFESSEYLPSSFCAFLWENAKSGGAETTEEALGWALSPVIDTVYNKMVMGDVGNVEGYNIDELKESLSVAFCSGMLQGSIAQSRAIFDNYTRVSTQDGKNKLMDILKEVRKMERNASTELIDLGNGYSFSEAQVLSALDQSITESIEEYYGKSALGDAVQSVQQNAVENYTEELTQKADEITQPERDKYISSLEEQARTLEEKMKNIDAARAQLTISLMQRGMDISADEYIKMDQQTRAETKTIYDTLGKRVRTSFMRLIPGQNGVQLGDTMVINTDQRRTFSFDLLADVDDDTFNSGLENVTTDSKQFFDKVGASPSIASSGIHEAGYFAEISGLYKQVRNLVIEAAGRDRFNTVMNRIGRVYEKMGIQANAEHEAVSFFLQQNLNNAEFLAKMARHNSSVFERIKDNILGMVSKDSKTKLENTFMRALDDARRQMNVETRQLLKSNKSGYVGENYISPDIAMMSVGEYDRTGRGILETYLANSGLSEEARTDLLNRMEETYKVMTEFMETGKYPEFSNWQDTVYSVDREGNFSVVISNGDYDLNLDFSTVCKKRKMMDKVLNELTKQGFLDTELTKDQLTMMRQIIEEHGMEVACGLCFVDAKRFNQGAWAGKFERKWNALIDRVAGLSDVGEEEINTFGIDGYEASPSLANIDFSDPKFASLVEESKGSSEEARMIRAIISDPSLRSYVSPNNMYSSKGFEELKINKPKLYDLANASGGSSKPKLAHTEVLYMNEVINNDAFNPDDAKKVGGVRIQSFSDFMTNMVFDYVQMFGDMEAKGLTAHSYTKVKEYALLFGRSGVKINLSIIPAGFDDHVYTAEEIKEMKKTNKKQWEKLRENAGLDENGNYIFDKESFDWNLALEIQNLDGYDANVGTVCVGVSDKHISKMLDDPNVCMIIPYHRSGINPAVAEQMGIGIFNDYTKKQNTRFRKSNGKPGTKVGHTYDFDFYSGFTTEDGTHFNGMIENDYDAKATADEYLAWCDKNNYVPKFDAFRDHPNYYKLLIDFRAYDKNGNIAPQNPVRISGEGMAMGPVQIDPEVSPMLAKLYGTDVGFKNVLQNGLDVYEETESNQNKELPSIANEMVDKLGLKKQFSLGETQFSQGESEQLSAGEGFELVEQESGDMVPPAHVDGEVVDGYGEERTQRFASSNIPKSQIFNEEQHEQIRQEVEDGKFTYIGLTNKVEVQRAREWMERDGVDATYEKFMSNNSPNAKSVVQGEVLIQELAKSKDPRWHDVAVKMADDATLAGQMLQAYSIMQRLTPEGQLAAVQRNLNRMQQEMDNRFGNKAPQLELREELVENLRNAKTAEEAEKARDEIQKDLIRQMPITLSSMLDAWRYLAMLGNPRTHIRNILGNSVFIPAIELKNAIATGLESIAGNKLDYRTKSILNPFSEADNALVELGKKAYDEYKNAIEKGQKYERKSFSENTLLGKALNKASDFNSELLDKEDFIFSKDRYARSYAQFLKANNLTAETLTPEMDRRANAYALLEAEKATYRDANAVAEWFNELERSNKKGLRMASYVKKAVLPFTKTPMNIIKRGLRYSPVGLVETITLGTYGLKNNTINANQYIDNLASGMSGSMIALLGVLLTSMGLFRTKDDESKRKNYFDQENGEQDYAIDLSPLGIEGTYTVDWMSPVIMPLAMGSELYSAFKDLTDIDGVESVAGLIADIVSNLMDPVVETSMLSGLKDTMKSYSSNGGEYFGQVLLAVASNYVQQMFPTLGGQLARTIDDTRRTTYPNKGFFDKNWRQIRNKLPGLSMLNEPYINKEGKAEKTEDLGMGAFGRLVLNTLSPGYYSSKDIDQYDEELYRLYSKTGEEDALPSSTSASLTYDKEPYKFSPEEYTQWHKARYETESQYVNSFIDSDVYKNLSDKEKVSTIKDIRSYAQKVAKRQFLESQGYTYTDDKELAERDDKYVYDKQLVNAEGAMDNGIELYSYYDYLNNAGSKQAEKMKYLEEAGLTKEQKDYLWSLNDYKTSYEDVYKKVFGSSDDSSSKKKSSSTSSKKSSSRKKKTTVKKIAKAPSGGGGSIRLSQAPNVADIKTDTKKVASSYLKAYASTFNRNRGSVSNQTSSTTVCPRCHNRVPAGSNRCPVCGTRLG